MTNPLRLACAALLLLTTGTALAQAPTTKPAIVYDLGGKFDKSFNEGVFAGAEKFKRESGVEYRDFEPQNDAQREQALRRFARDGHSPILAVGFSQESALKKVAAEFPNLRFTIIDSVVDLPNVQSITFKEHEGSYLVGLLAGMASKGQKVGFVGGMDIPLIRRFACGYVQGAKAAAKPAEVFQNMTGTTGAAWNDPPRAPSSPRARSIAARKWSTTRPAAPVSACCARPRMRASSASASIPTRTSCTPARSSPPC
jgi:basic membrane protein A